MTERAIFIAALQKDDPADRQAYLDEACGGRSELRSQVEDLLRLYENAGSFLQEPAAESAATGAFAVPTEPAASTETPGAMIGPFKLLEQIGEGGMGDVWMAEQSEPIQRRVAIKVIKAGMDSKQVLARFDAERQALALMDHPNIAKVLDAGATATGRPYFVMELVKGTPITKFCDEKKLNVRERLELFGDVCRAVQHAHQKGIIHRDIKPSNVLVAPYDGRPVVKVIDFGVAKATGQKLTEATLFTGFGAVVSTPEYMSPEQAEVNNQDIDTRSDIYSLGVLLYELLTGSTPLTKKRVKEAAFLEVLRVIREEESPKPSTRLSSTEELPSISAQRHTEPAKLTKLVRGELDWIVMKALEKDRNRRYETANGFAMDVQRYLADESVQACPPSAGYRLRKFVRRNRSKLVVSGVLAAAFLVAVGGIGYAVRDRSARHAEAERERNERQTRTTTQVELILADVGRLMKEQKWGEALAMANRAEAALGGGEAIDAMLGKVAEMVKELEFVERLEQVRMVSSIWRNNGFDHAGAARGYGEAFHAFGVDVESLPIEVAESRLKYHERIALPIAAALDHWVDCRRRAIGMDEPGWRQLVALAKQLDPDPMRNRLRDAWGRSVTSELQAELRKLAQSFSLRTQTASTISILAATLRRARLEHLEERVLRQGKYEFPGDFWLNISLGNALSDRKQHDEAAACYSAALGIKPTSSVAVNNLGTALSVQGKLDEAVICFRKAIQHDPIMAYAYMNLGHDLRIQGKLDEAIDVTLRAIELDPKLAGAHDNLGIALTDHGKLDAAIASFKKAIELDPKFVSAHYNLGTVLHRQMKLDDAIASYRKAIKFDPKYVSAHHNLGHALNDQGNLDDAIASYRKAIELDPRFAMAYNNLGTALNKKGKPDDAVAAYRKAIEIDPKNYLAHWNLGNCLCDQDMLDDAVACYRTAIQLDPKRIIAHTGLGNALIGQGKRDVAIAAYRTAIELDSTDADDHLWLGIAIGKQGMLDEAIACFHRVIELDPKSALAHDNIGICLRDQGKLNEAIASYRTAIELDRKNVNAHLNLGEALRLQGKPDEAAASYRTAFQLDPKNVRAQLDLGETLRIQGKLDEAIAFARTAIEHKPQLANAHLNLGNALLDLKRLDEAAASFLKALELDPKYVVAHNNFGNVLRKQGQLEKAINCYRMAIELDPKYVLAHFNLGIALWQQGKHEEAIASYRQATKHNPKYLPAIQNLGHALSRTGNHVDAIQTLRRAIELDPRNATTLNHVAWILTTTEDKKLRDPKEALALARRAVTITEDWGKLDTLSLAAFRCGEWKESLDARLKMIKLRPARTEDKLILSMVHWHLGKKDEARRLYTEAISDFGKLPKRDAWLTGIKKAADALLGAAEQSPRERLTVPPREVK